MKNLTPAHGQGASGSLRDLTSWLGTIENTQAINLLSVQYAAVLFQDQVRTLFFLYKTENLYKISDHLSLHVKRHR